MEMGHQLNWLQFLTSSLNNMVENALNMEVLYCTLTLKSTFNFIYEAVRP